MEMTEVDDAEEKAFCIGSETFFLPVAIINTKPQKDISKICSI